MAKKITQKKDEEVTEVVDHQAERLKNIEALINNINKSMGKVVIGKASNNEIASKLTVKTIPTPSMKLNNALGGGFPKGKFTIYTGDPDSGKTFLMLNTIAKNQKEDPYFIAAWAESENSLNDKSLDMFNIDRNRFILYKVGTEGGEIAMDAIVAMAQSNVDLIVINSLKHITPTKEIKDSMEDQNVALQARLNAKLMRKITGILTENDTAMVAIQHKSTEIGSYIPSKKIVGGDAIMYAAYLIVDNAKININSSNPLYALRDEFMQFKAKVLKNHLVVDRKPYVQVEYTVKIGEGIDTVREVAELAEEQDILSKKGAWIREYDDSGAERILPDGTKCAWNGTAKFYEFLYNNPDYVDYLKNKVSQINLTSLSQDEIDTLTTMEQTYTSKVEDILDETEEENK